MRAALAAMCCLATGCATIVAGGPDQVPVRTNPSGAYVYLDGQVVGRTPLVLTLDRSRTLGDIRPSQLADPKLFDFLGLGARGSTHDPTRSGDAA